ncbi:MAG: transposase [Candidatus Eisenbacteria bacterium]|nr:transposase [Candidatus Eisenbacteria bacterium]
MRWDQRLGLIDAFAHRLRDPGESGKVRHTVRELVAQRVMSMACGYPDGNDAARLATDPLHKLLVNRHPTDDPASLPNRLSRFENAVGPKDLFRLGEALLEQVWSSITGDACGTAARLITIDLDATDDQTHGGQQLSFFNTHYDGHCYLPLLGFLTFDREPEQYLFAAILRAGNAPGKLGAIGLLRRLLPRLRQAFPQAHLRVRLDGGFAGPEVLEFLEAEPRLTSSWDWPRTRCWCSKPRSIWPKHGRSPSRARSRSGSTASVSPSGQVEAQAARHHQGRGGALPGPLASRQPALRGYQHPATWSALGI